MSYKSSRWLIRILIFLNLLVFAAWHGFLDTWIHRIYDGDTKYFLAQYFLVSYDRLVSGTYFSALGSVFSHVSVLHFFVNMFVLYNFGPLLASILGLRRFLSFYIIAGIFASISHSVVSYLLLADPTLPALGASGAISGLILLFSFLFPKEKILLFGLIPVPAMMGAVFFVGLDLWGLYSQSKGGGFPIGHGAHLGGAFCGATYYFIFLRKKIRAHSKDDPITQNVPG